MKQEQNRLMKGLNLRNLQVLQGASSLNTVALTGESAPRPVKEGDTVLSGCVNIQGVLRVRVNHRNLQELQVPWSLQELPLKRFFRI